MFDRARAGKEMPLVDLKMTKRQEEIYGFISKHLESYGYPPTVREIGKAVGLTSSSTVHAHLAKLESSGLLRRDPSKPRALELMKEKAKQALAPAGTPVVGRVAAGEPIVAEENIEEYVDLPAFLGARDEDYLLKVRGESMSGIGIMDGDLVLVHPQQSALDGQVVVALIENEATVKRYFRESSGLRLEAENPAYAPILTREATILGRVVGVMRAL